MEPSTRKRRCKTSCEHNPKIFYPHLNALILLPQYHFYIEPQSSVAIPDEDGGLVLTLACQGISRPRVLIADYLGVQEANVIVNTRRVGGAFGGKASRCVPSAILASHCAVTFGRPVRLVLPREVDMALNAGRQEITSNFSALVESKTGKIKALKYNFNFAQGNSLDLGLIHGMLLGGALDEVYKLDNVLATIRFKHTHDGTSTSVRGPGHFEAVMAMETVIDTVAGATGITPEKVREINFWPHRKFLGTQGLSGSILPPSIMEGKTSIPLWNKLIKDSKYWERKKSIDEFNKSNTLRKRGIAITPARYGMIRSGGQGARIDILRDGSIQIGTSGIEMGQGI